MKLKSKMMSILLAMVMIVAAMPVTTYAIQEVETKDNNILFTDMSKDWSEAAIKNGLCLRKNLQEHKWQQL